MKQKIIDIIERSREVELECINPYGFTRHGHVNERLLSHGKFIIKGYSKDRFSLRLDDEELDLLNICRAQAYINDYELDYFKIKEEEAATFDDLIDVAVKAAKDGLLVINRLHDDFISAKLANKENQEEGFIFDYGHKGGFENSINKIKSLYTETFVIESEDDMIKMNNGSKGVLLNGLEFRVTDTAVKMFDGENDLAITVNFDGMDHNELLYLSPLKGATVTQKRTNTKSSTTSTEPVQLDLFD